MSKQPPKPQPERVSPEGSNNKRREGGDGGSLDGKCDAQQR